MRATLHASSGGPGGRARRFHARALALHPAPSPAAAHRQARCAAAHICRSCTLRCVAIPAPPAAADTTRRRTPPRPPDRPHRRHRHRPGRGAVGIVRSPGGLEPLIQALCARALPARQAVYTRSSMPPDSPSTRGWRCFPGAAQLHRRGRAGCRPTAARWCCNCCWPLPEAPPEASRCPGPALRLACGWPSRASSPARLPQRQLDLAQAEAVADLIDASTEAAARSADALAGRVLARWKRCASVDRPAHAGGGDARLPEEEIDFLEQADARGQPAPSQPPSTACLTARTRRPAARGPAGGAGRPAQRGQVRLLNALAGAELAIVTPIPAPRATRCSETIQIEGVPLRDRHRRPARGRRRRPGHRRVERIGIQRSWQAIAEADAVIFLHDPDASRPGRLRGGRGPHRRAAALDQPRGWIHVHK